MLFKDSFNALLLQKGATQADVAKFLKITASAVSFWANGKTKIINPTHIVGLANFFQIPMEDMMAIAQGTATLSTPTIKNTPFSVAITNAASELTELMVLDKDVAELLIMKVHVALMEARINMRTTTKA
jgi:transcriptional regulator with XRE-family HTH domain